ncbi:MAG: 2TM domain-containing protein [Alphaproteobacteria bacterium]|nr:2TM domain-containing protein [Alphaproteobacteria bacterium]
MLSEEEVRKKVRALRRLYIDTTTFVVMNIALILIWLTFDSSSIFWPKYVILISAIALIFRAYRMNIFPLFCNRIPFLTKEWEDKKVKEMMGHHDVQKKVTLARDKKR